MIMLYRFLKKYNWLFLLLIPFYFILDSSNQFWGLIPFFNASKIFIVIVVLSGFVFLAGGKIAGKERSVLITTWLMLNYLFFKIIYSVASEILMPLGSLRYRIYFIILFIFTLILLVVLFKAKVQRIVKVGIFFNALFLCLVVVELCEVLVNEYSPKSIQVKVDSLDFKPIQKQTKPDVFLIVMDEYAGFKALEYYYGFDNSEFKTQLGSRGFFVANDPNSNYDGTFFSMLSLMSLGYLKAPANDEKLIVNGYAKTVLPIEDNQLTNFFHKNGYQIINNSFFKIKNSRSKPISFLRFEESLVTSKTLGYFFLNEVLIGLPSNSLQFKLNTYYAKVDTYNQNVINQTSNAIENKETPMFVYSHLLMPHKPYLRKKNGELRNFVETLDEFKKKDYQKSYLEYLEYCNSVILRLIDRILLNRSNCIIVLVSDHGNRWIIGNSRKRELDFSNFLSVYSSDRNYAGLSDTISSVNLFRFILNNQFNQNLSPLPNFRNSVFEKQSK